MKLRIFTISIILLFAFNDSKAMDIIDFLYYGLFASPQAEEEIVPDSSSVMGKWIGDKMAEAITVVLQQKIGKEGDVTTDEAAITLIGKVQPAFRESISKTISELKDEGIAKITPLVHRTRNTGKKILMGSLAITTLVFIYNLCKRLTHPGSLNKDDLNKSNLIVKSSGFTNGILSRISNLFRSPIACKRLILEPTLREQVRKFVQDFMFIVNNIDNKEKNVKFNSVILSGPKGNGKTLFTDHLIRLSGLDYITINSSTFINFEGGAEFKAFIWLLRLLKNPKKRIMVVVEEADILLNRSIYKDKLMDLLKWLKVNNNKFMLVICAENKKSLPNDLLTLMDDTIELNLPSIEEREKFLKHHTMEILQKYQRTALVEIIASIFNISKIKKIAQETEGFSYSELEVLVNKIKAEILLAKEKFSKEQADRALRSCLALHKILTSPVN